MSILYFDTMTIIGVLSGASLFIIEVGPGKIDNDAGFYSSKTVNKVK